MSYDYVVTPGDPQLQLLPTEDRIPLTAEETKNLRGLGGGYGCLVWGVFYFVLFLISYVALMSLSTFGDVRNGDQGAATFASVFSIITASIGTVLVSTIVKNTNVPKAERKKAQQSKANIESANQQARKRARDEAHSLTSRLNSLLTESDNLLEELTNALRSASHFIELAHREYEDEVPGPFWDAIENCAYSLDDYNSIARQLSQNAATYYSLLNGRKHTFPPFPIQLNNLPDPTPVIEDLRQVVRLGQRAEPKPHFYDVWERRREHRLTRQLMATGFHTLSDAVNNVGTTLLQSVKDLQQAVSSDIATIVNQEIQTRTVLVDAQTETQKIIDRHAREHSRMLDNIQRDRKPLI